MNLAELTPPPDPTPDEHLSTTGLHADLRGRTVRAGAVTLSGQAARFAMTVGSTVLLARLLAPEDYGVVGMVTAVTGFLVVFQDLGLSAATVQREELTHAQASNVFWLNAALGVALAALLAAGAPALAWFYGDPRLTAVALWLSAGTLLTALGGQHQALLRRRMRFGTLAAVDLSALAVGIAAAVTLAVRGAGYWSLVALPLSAALAQTAGYWVACRWRPSRPRRGAGVRGMVRFGGYLTGFNIANYFARGADNVLIGRYWGAGPLGLYTRAYTLFMLPLGQVNGPVAAVLVPALSRLQDQPDRLRTYYVRGLTLVNLLAAPVVVMLFVESHNIVGLMLGPDWLAAGDVLRWLALAAVFQPTCNTSGWLYVATARTRRMFAWGLASSALLVLGFAAGLPWGPQGVAAAYAAVSTALAVPCMWAATRGTAVTLADVFAGTWRPALAAVASALLALGLYHWVGRPSGAAASIAASAAVVGATYAVLMFGVLGSFAGYAALLRALRTREKGA